jgi:hypothetical protein
MEFKLANSLNLENYNILNVLTADAGNCKAKTPCKVDKRTNIQSPSLKVKFKTNQGNGLGILSLSMKLRASQSNVANKTMENILFRLILICSLRGATNLAPVATHIMINILV